MDMKHFIVLTLMVTLPLAAVAEKVTKTRAGYPENTQDYVTDTLRNGFYYLDYFHCDMFVDGLAYNIVSKEDRTVELTNLSPSEMWGDRWIYWMDTMHIPEKVTWRDTVYTVVGIGRGALQYSEINHLEMPTTITTIKQFTFNACGGLKELRLPAHITRYEDYAFSGAVMDVLEFPESVEFMGKGLFTELFPGAEGAKIGKLILPKNLEILPANMFYVAQIGDLTIPASVKGAEMGVTSDRTFIRVLRMEHKDPPSGILKCDTLIVPDGCKAEYLKHFSPGTSFKVICETSEYTKMNGLFENDGVLYRIPSQYGDTVVAVKAYNEEVFIPATTEYGGHKYSVVEVALSQEEPIRSLVIDEGIRRLGVVSNPRGLSALEELVLPGSIKEIPTNYFRTCSNLEDVDLSEGIEVIGYNAFEDAKLSVLYIPASVKRINGPLCCVRGDDQSALERIIVDSGNKFYHSGSEQQAIVETATGRLIQGGSDCLIPMDVKVIGTGTFCQKELSYWNRGSGFAYPATDIILPEGIEEIEMRAFCLDSIGTLHIPVSLKNIGNAFETSSIRSIVLEDGTGTSCLGFYGIPTSILEISRFPRDPVLHMESVYCGRNTSPFFLNSLIPKVGVRTITSIVCDTLTIGPMIRELSEVSNDIIFHTINSMITDPDKVVPHFTQNIYLQATLFVPQGTKQKYRSAEGWKNFANIIEFGETAIVGINYSSPRESKLYSLDGRQLKSPQKGINIIHQSDGTTKKVLMK